MYNSLFVPKYSLATSSAVYSSLQMNLETLPALNVLAIPANLYQLVQCINLVPVAIGFTSLLLENSYALTS